MGHIPSEIQTHPSLLLRVGEGGDTFAWQEFAQIYAPAIFRYCRLRQLQESDAADVTQEVLFRLARALPAFKYDKAKGRFRDWLGQVVHRELLRFWGQAKRRSIEKNAFSIGDEGVDAVCEQEQSQWLEHFYAEILRASLAAIEHEFERRTWAAFTQTWIEERTPAEVAVAIGMGVDKVYVAKSRVLKRLRAELERHFDNLPMS